MRSQHANGDSGLALWQRVREFAVPPSMIECATARRQTGDWAGACAAARVEVDLDLRSVARAHGRELAARIRDDLRHLAPDLLRWHMPRIAPDGLLRPGLTICLARYDQQGDRDGGGGGGGLGDDRAVRLVVRTPPGWADGGQRISLALWDGGRSRTGAEPRHPPRPYPHPHPSQRFRLDLHRHLWDARRTDELRIRSGLDDRTAAAGRRLPADSDQLAAVPLGRGCAVNRWAAEAGILLRAEGRPDGTGTVAVRLSTRRWLLLEVVAGGDGPGPPGLRSAEVSARGGASSGVPVLPDAATWTPPDLELLRHGRIEAGRLHPLVAAALAPDTSGAGPPQGAELARGTRLVECRGTWHRIGLVNGVLSPMDHDPAEIRREELLAALTGVPLPCLQEIDKAHRHPERLQDIRTRLDHGDTAGALAAAEGLLGPEALLRGNALRDELETAALRRVTHGLFRAGLAGTGCAPIHREPRRARDRRSHPRLARRH